MLRRVAILEPELQRSALAWGDKHSPWGDDFTESTRESLTPPSALLRTGLLFTQLLFDATIPFRVFNPPTRANTLKCYSFLLSEAAESVIHTKPPISSVGGIYNISN